MLRNLMPLADRVLVKRLMPATKTAGGVLLPDSATSKPNEGEVLAVGPGITTRDGSVIKLPLSVGDKVLLPDFGGTTIKLEGEEAILFRSDEILATFSK